MEASIMRASLLARWLICLLIAGAGIGWLILRNQVQPPIAPAAPAPSIEANPVAVEPARPARDWTKLPLLQLQMYQSAQRGSDWLYRANGSDGHFSYGSVPSLKVMLEGDNYLRQAGAAFALARAARFNGDPRYVARARQAVLLLLADTAVDAKNPDVRTTTMPQVVVNRLAAAGLMLMAIHELPTPAEDLLQQGEQLANYIRTQQQADGSLSVTDLSAEREAQPDAEGISTYPGEALYGLMLSQRHRPAAWKTDLARKALKYYQPWWRAHKSTHFVPCQTAAYTEAYLLTREQPFADFVNEMNDWLCELQHPPLDPRHPLWGGGFNEWIDNRGSNAAPTIGSAGYAESLAEACRLARKTGDLNRYRHYRESLERCLQFLCRLQYTEANTQHFADWYRPALVGAFYASHQDGNIRIDYTQHSVCALLMYLVEVVE
jgi:hypothetical protein